MPQERGGSNPSSPGSIRDSRPGARRESQQSVGGKDATSDLARVQALSRELFKHVNDTETIINKGYTNKKLVKSREVSEIKMKAIRRVKEGLGMVQVADEAAGTGSFCLSRLQHEHYALGASLMVCQRRLELREGRPPQSAKEEDTMQDALLSEQEILTSAREAMLVLGGELMRRIDEVAKVRNDISGETAQIRRDAVDQSGGALGAKSVASSVASSPRAGGTPGGKGVSPGMTLLKGTDLTKRTYELRSEMDDLQVRTDSLISQSQRAASQASAHVNEILQQRTNVDGNLTRKMRSHVTDADFALLVAERALDRTVRKLDPDDAQALSRFAASKGMVEELRSTRKDLSEDLWRRTVSLNIDEACRKVTPQWAAGCCERAPPSRKQKAETARR